MYSYIPLPLLLEEDYMSNTTRIVHLFVMDVAKLSMYILELLSVIIIVYSTFRAFYKLFKHQSYARVYLLHGQSVGLTFKLGAEILRTVVARNINDIWEVALLIVIKAAMVLLIEWELKGIEASYVDHDSEEHKMPSHGFENPRHVYLKKLKDKITKNSRKSEESTEPKGTENIGI
ncbi:DUF1622 domain-containing protein [Ileibacterium valens]|uniref:DUF1622 domain-containing protein n=1 Tax=Ileibacterium valens TaxID=1862668 RepID=UPI00235439E4|nr:DUF1622 domain-containing protein [Ileibacterium valens]